MSPPLNRTAVVLLVTALCVPLLASCGGNAALRESRELAATGRTEDALARLQHGMHEAPDDREIRIAYFRQRELTIAPIVASADADRATGRWDAAESGFRRALTLDPQHPRALNGLQEVAAARRHAAQLADAEARLQRGELAAAESAARGILGEDPSHAGARTLLVRLRQAAAAGETPAQTLKAAFAKPITLEFRDTPLKTVFEVIARTAGVNFAIDKDVRADAKVNLFIRNAAIEDAIRLVLVTHQLERKLLNENSVLIYPNTPAKAKEHLDLVSRTFHLANTDAKQAQTLLRTIGRVRDIYVDERLNLLVIKDTPDAVRYAEQLIASIDLAEPEVMLDVEVLELSRTRLDELGVRFPDQVGYGRVVGNALAGGVIDLSERSALAGYVANPGLLLNLRNEDGQSNLLANPRIRVRNRDKAKIHIGEKLPVFTTTSTANVGVSASVAYLDVGLKLDVEPNVYLDDDVAIKVALEVSSIVREVSGPAASLAYQVGTRSATTSLRLKNGETQILAGLISDEERSSGNRLPGLGDIPILGRLFGSQRDSASKTEIVLLITPRVVRNQIRPESAGPTLHAGTETAVGAPPTRIAPTRPGQVGVAAGANAGAGAAPSTTPDPAVGVGREPPPESSAPPGSAADPADAETAGRAEPPEAGTPPPASTPPNPVPPPGAAPAMVPVPLPEMR